MKGAARFLTRTSALAFFFLAAALILRAVQGQPIGTFDVVATAFLQWIVAALLTAGNDAYARALAAGPPAPASTPAGLTHHRTSPARTVNRPPAPPPAAS